MAQWLAARTTDVQPATVPGRLVAIPAGDGWYPALLPGRASERCRGTVVSAKLTRGELALLDRYEGREYRRCAVRTRFGSGQGTAFAYLWRGAPPAIASAIPGDDFLGWLERTQRRPLSTRRNGA